MTAPATLDQFKSTFDRDFIFGVGMETVRDKDISTAFTQAAMVFNIDLWDPTLEAPTAFMYAAAHFIALNVQAAGGLAPRSRGQGVGSQGGGITQSKSVGSVSIAYAIPPKLLDDPLLAQFMQTNYGQQYLMMVAPRLVAGLSVVAGPHPPDIAPGPVGQ